MNCRAAIPSAPRAATGRRIIPILPADPLPLRAARDRQRQRVLAQALFFVIFVAAPVFDVFRYDLTLGHFFLLGFPWRLGLDGLLAGRDTALQAAGNVLLRGFLPLAAVVGAALFVSWRWGRLYCGWLCPHFSVVETINRMMWRASGRQSIWDREATPYTDLEGRRQPPRRRWWLPTLLLAAVFAFAWSVVLLTYLLPPFEIYRNLLEARLTFNQLLFISVATIAFSAEFLLARHLFCRYGCAVGLFQSLAWIGNRAAMVVGFDRRRAADCAGCDSACDAVCPMRLRPRNLKRLMFACTQCGQCLSACASSQRDRPDGPLLTWVTGLAARENEAGYTSAQIQRRD